MVVAVAVKLNSQPPLDSYWSTLAFLLLLWNCCWLGDDTFTCPKRRRELFRIQEKNSLSTKWKLFFLISEFISCTKQVFPYFYQILHFLCSQKNWVQVSSNWKVRKSYIVRLSLAHWLESIVFSHLFTSFTNTPHHPMLTQRNKSGPLFIISLLYFSLTHQTLDSFSSFITHEHSQAQFTCACNTKTCLNRNNNQHTLALCFSLFHKLFTLINHFNTIQ